MKAAFVAASLVVLTFAPATAFAQDAASRPSPDGATRFTRDQVRFTIYRPRHADPKDLYHAVVPLIGREITVIDPDRGPDRTALNLNVVGSTVIVYDTPAYTQRVMDLISEVETSAFALAQDSPDTNQLVRFEPRHTDAALLLGGIRPLARLIPDAQGSHPNIAQLPGRNVLNLHDSPDRVAKMLELLRGLDVPLPQVTLTVHVLRGVETTEPAPVAAAVLPDALRDDLQKLVPFPRFDPIAFGLIRTSVAPDREVSLDLTAGSGEKMRLELTPDAYDAATGSLSAHHLKFRAVPTAQPGFASAPAPYEFQTSAVLKGGDYTVVGAFGHAAVFVVVQVTPLKP